MSISGDLHSFIIRQTYPQSCCFTAILGSGVLSTGVALETGDESALVDFADEFEVVDRGVRRVGVHLLVPHTTHVGQFKEVFQHPLVSDIVLRENEGYDLVRIHIDEGMDLQSSAVLRTDSPFGLTSDGYVAECQTGGIDGQTPNSLRGILQMESTKICESVTGAAEVISPIISQQREKSRK